jgi:hypothetical protein
MSGGKYALAVEEHTAERTVESTGGLSSFDTDTFYLPITASGRHTLTLRATEVSDGGLMVFKSVRLTPSRRESDDPSK